MSDRGPAIIPDIPLENKKRADTKAHEGLEGRQVQVYVALALSEWSSFATLRVYLRVLRVEEFCVSCEPGFSLDSGRQMESLG